MPDKKITDLPLLVTQLTTDVYEISNTVGTLSSKETRTQMTNWMSANVQISESQVTNLATDLAAKLNLAGGTMTGDLFLDADPTVDLQAATKHYVDNAIGSDNSLQEVYNNGTPGQLGSITLTSDNLNPIATFNDYISGGLATYQEHFSAINNTSDNVFWGYGFKAPNSSANFKDFAHIYANVQNNTAGDESGSLSLYVSSFGVLTPAFTSDGANQETTSAWPMTIANGARSYQTTILLTGAITYSSSYTGALILSNDLGDHTITINNYFSTNGDDSFVVQTQSTNVATLTLSGGVTINGSASDFIIPINTRATVQLVNAGTKAFMVTMVSLPMSSIAFSAYATSAQNGVTGSGTSYTVQFDSQTGDTSPDFNTSTGIFTAPIAGFYQFSASINCSGLNSNNTVGILFLQTTSQYFVLSYNNPYIIMNTGGLNVEGSATVFLNAGDTARIVLLIDLNLTDNVNVLGDPATAYTYFSGSYIQSTGIGGGGGGGEVNVIDDNSTNATMYPLFVADTSGAQPTYVSSQGFQWNPSTQKLSIGNDNFGNNISVSGLMLEWSAGHDPVWDLGQLYGSALGSGFGPPNFSIYDYNNSTFLLIADTEGDIGVNPTTLYFMYPYNSFPNSTSPNHMVVTDGNNLITSIPFAAVSLQDAYDAGTPGQQGSIGLTTDNLNPIATFNSYNVADQEHFVALNSATTSLKKWGYGFRASNSTPTYVDYAHIYANVQSNSAGFENGSLGLYAKSNGTLTQAILMDGQNQVITCAWPVSSPVILSQVCNAPNAIQTLNANTTTQVEYTQVNFDSNSLYDAPTFSFIIVVAGYYRVNASVFINGIPGSARLSLYLYQNGSLVQVLDNGVFSDANILNGAYEVYCNPADTLSLYVNNALGSTTTSMGTGNTDAPLFSNFSIQYIRP